MIYKGIETNKEIKKTIKEISVKTDVPLSDICKKLNIMPQSYQNIFKKRNLLYVIYQKY